jgi:hypothetical protein
VLVRFIRAIFALVVFGCIDAPAPAGQSGVMRVMRAVETRRAAGVVQSFGQCHMSALQVSQRSARWLDWMSRQSCIDACTAQRTGSGVQVKQSRAGFVWLSASGQLLRYAG